jgi:CHAT domain-containing protein
MAMLETVLARVFWAVAPATLLLAPLPLAAQDHAPTLARLQARDRLAAPEGELAAWQAFAAQLAADPAAELDLRAQTHLGLAVALLYAKQFDPGWQEITRARAAMEHLPQAPAYAAELTAYEALLLTELGRTDEARARATTALAMATALGPTAFREQALAHNALGGIAFAGNDFAAAEAEYCLARDLGLAAPQPDHPMIVNDAASCGVVKYFLERPDTQAAMRVASDHAFAHLPPDHPKMGNVLNSAYAVLLRYGRYGEAEPLIRRHLDLERRLHAGDADDIYDPLSMLGRALELRGSFADSEAIFAAAAAMAGRLRDQSLPYNRGMARINLARVIGRQGRLAEAEAEARSGLTLLEEDLAPGDWNIGSGQVQLADHLDMLGRREDALAMVDQGLALLTPQLAEGHSEVLTARLIRARILAGLGRADAALEEARGASTLFETQMFDLAASETDRIALSRVLPAAFADHVATALAAGSLEDAVHGAQLFALSELAVPNARIAAATLARADGAGALVEALEAARAQVVELSAQFNRAQADGAADAGALATRLTDARKAAAQAQAELQLAFPDYAALTRPQVPALAELQAQLAPGELLVLPLALPDRAVTIAIARGSVAWGETRITAPALAALAQGLRTSAEAPGRFDVAAARALFDLVFPAELLPALTAADTLLFPASGYLARLSPAVLLSGPADPDSLADAPWLVRSHAIRIVADTATLRPATATLAARGFLGVGAPDVLPLALASQSPVLRSGEGVGTQLPALPNARAELRQLARTLDSAATLVLAGPEATEERLAALDLASYGVIAFATHGLAGGDVPGLDEPALLLTATDPARKQGDGLLTASEIATLRLDADWVILSACETAAGESASAPGYSGLARAFAQAGARSLMLSHWRVRDDAAAILSVETLRGAAHGQPRAQALRQA